MNELILIFARHDEIVINVLNSENLNWSLYIRSACWMRTNHAREHNTIHKSYLESKHFRGDHDLFTYILDNGGTASANKIRKDKAGGQK